MDDVMAGISARDYKLHSMHFSVGLKSFIGPDEFLLACNKRGERWGQPVSRKLVAIFRKEKSFTLIWDMKYDSTPNQVVAMTTIALKGGRYFVDHFLLH